MKKLSRLKYVVDKDIMVELLIMIEMVICTISISILIFCFSSIYSFEKEYEKLGIENIAQVRPSDNYDSITEIITEKTSGYVGAVYGIVNFEIEEEYYDIQIVSKDYFSWYSEKIGIKFDFDKNTFDPIIFATNINIDENIIKQIEEFINTEKEIEIHQLPNENQYWPSCSFTDFFSINNNRAFLVIDEKEECTAFMMKEYVFDKSQIDLSALDDEGIIYTISYEAEKMALFKSFSEEKSRIPCVIAVVMILMFIVGLSIYKENEIVSAKKSYSIMFICGVPWKKCLQLKIIFDFVLVIFTNAVTFLADSMFDIRKNYCMDDNGCLIVAMLICSILYFSLDVSPMLKLKKYEPIELLRGID